MDQNILCSKLQETLKIKSLRLPSNVGFSLIKKTLSIKIEKGLCMNMQTNDSAFEAWAICLKFNLPELIDNVVIEWDIHRVDKANLHYNRFLYRVWKFTLTFSWARCVVYDFSQYNTAGWVLNYPKHQASEEAIKKEAKEERAYINMHKDMYTHICNQLPVGLFNKEISHVNRITPGQNSQLDIWAIKENTLHIFELKIDTNKTVGIITELMFYVNVMNDLVNGSIQFDKNSKEVTIRQFDKLHHAITNGDITQIEGHFLTNNLHPLITQNVLDGINQSQSNIIYSHTKNQNG